MTAEDVDKETGPWVNTGVAGATPPLAPDFSALSKGKEEGAGTSRRQPGTVHILQVAVPGAAGPLEGATGSCVDAAERGVMTWRFV